MWPDHRRSSSACLTRLLGPFILAAGACLLAVLALMNAGSMPVAALLMGGVLLVTLALVLILGRRLEAAHELALVAALAALATASRVLFAALPNFKPVTFIVMASGIALGPSSGFMVGAATGLVSNFFFGQGPWTPWQMLGWGIAGLVGGILGKIRPKPSRLIMAVAAGVLSLAFDWFVSIWMFIAFTNRSLGALVALLAQGIPFDVAHVAASTLCAVAFGPQIVKILARFHVRTSPRLIPVEDEL